MKRVIARTGRKTRTVTADRGYGEQSVDDDLAALGVRHVVIPRKGKPGKARQGRGTPAGVPADGEVADRMRRTDQHPQTRIRVGPHPGSMAPKEQGSGPANGVLAQNLVKIAALTA